MSAAVEHHLLHRVRVRAAGWEDRRRIFDLLRPAEFVCGVPDDVLNRLFTYHWFSPKPNLGYVLTAGDRIVGYIGAVYSRRNLAGRDVNLCGLSTLYVDPAYRSGGSANPDHIRNSEALIGELVARKNWNFLGLSPSPQAAAIHRRLGFRRICRERWAFVPDWPALGALLRARKVHSDLGTVLRALPEAERRMARDHVLYGCQCYAVECEGGHSLVITKRSYIPRSAVLGSLPLARARRGHLPASLVLYIGNRAAASARWHELVARVALAERAAAVVVAEWMAPVPAGNARRIPRYMDLLGEGVEPPALDLAYSELALF